MKYIIIVFIILSSFLFFGCDKNNDDDSIICWKYASKNVLVEKPCTQCKSWSYDSAKDRWICTE